jgi:signal transduction histidine kinase
VNTRRGTLWWAFFAGALAVLAALTWASVAVLRLERRTETARQLAQRQETVRLALWRVDSQLAPVIAMEAARAPRERPPRGFGFSNELADAATTRTDTVFPNAFVDGFFTVDAAQQIDATDDRNRRIAGRLATDTAMLGRIAASPAPASRVALAADTEAAEVAPGPANTDAPTADPDPAQFDYAVRQQIANIGQRPEEQPALARQAKATNEDIAASSVASRGVQESASALAPEASPATDITPGPARLEPRWIETGPDALALVLVRTTPTEEGPLTQGVTLDWTALKTTLEASLADLLPHASIVPARGMAAAQIEREGRGFRLATVPALLLPGDFTPSVPLRMTPALWALVITWIAGLSALAAVGLVLRATLRLSDRRARFVGAVTHELRTPLTTFRLYAQMLAGGMVTDDKAKAEYLGTLERESIRLAEIVENVLEYARLTRRRPGAARPPGERSVSPSELLARVRPVLSRRAEQSGMDLIVSIEPGVEAPAAAGAPTVTCDPRSVERILMNLIENACKYAVPADPADAEDADTRIHLDLACTDRHLEILTADHGRGIPRRERERVFGEFQRGPGAAESSRPGLGLGLALSRGLAREMGGDLRLVRRRAHGAEFLLTIPLDPPTAPTP